MSKIKWDEIGKRFYETGVDRGVLYVMRDDGTYGVGVPWNGLTAVNESPEGGEPTAIYADNIKYLNLMSAEEYKATIEALMYPDEFAECDGSKEVATGVYIGQQTRKQFGFCYRTMLGNDTEGTKYGYKITIVYGASASPSSKDHSTINDSPETATFSYEISTVPVEIEGFDPSATIVIDSTKVDADKLKALEDILYGNSTDDARLPLPSEIISIIGTASPAPSSTPAEG